MPGRRAYAEMCGCGVCGRQPLGVVLSLIVRRGCHPNLPMAPIPTCGACRPVTRCPERATVPVVTHDPAATPPPRMCAVHRTQPTPQKLLRTATRGDQALSCRSAPSRSALPLPSSTAELPRTCRMALLLSSGSSERIRREAITHWRDSSYQSWPIRSSWLMSQRSPAGSTHSGGRDEGRRVLAAGRVDRLAVRLVSAALEV